MSARLRAAARRVPRPLAALLGATFLLALTWSFVTPPFQAPDEQSHFGYVQSLAAGPGLPGDPARPAFSTEQLLAHDASNSDQTAGNPIAKPEWNRGAWERWQREDAALPSSARSDGGGVNPAASNPPLAYLVEAVPYLAFSGGDMFARVSAARVLSVLWLLVTVVGAWLLAGEIFRRDRLLQLVTAGVAGLLPMVAFVSSQIGPDAPMYAFWSLALWLAVRTVKRGAEPLPAVALLAVTGLAIVTKATSYALLPAVLFALAVGLWRLPRRDRALRIAAGALAALAFPVLVWFLVARVSDRAVAAQVTSSSGPTGTNLRELVSYVWQYYLPRLPFMTATHGEGLPAYHVWVQQGWGAFGWLEVRLPGALYKTLAIVTLGTIAAAAARLVAVRRAIHLPTAIVLVLAVAALLAGLHWTDYHLTVTGSAFMQGRYAFPVVAIVGLTVAQALTWTRGGLRQVLAGGVLGGLVVLQLVSLSLVLSRFYA